jgi:uncharacterized protein YjbJ (UPF0337 family)
MSEDERIANKAGNKVDDLGGKAKEAAGRLTDDDRLKAEGRKDQAAAGLRDAVEDVKGAGRKVADSAKNRFTKD